MKWMIIKGIDNENEARYKYLFIRGNKENSIYNYPQESIETLDNQYVLVTTKSYVDEDLLKRNLLDAQLQLDLEKEFLPIRNMLVAQALDPYQEIDNLLIPQNNG